MTASDKMSSATRAAESRTFGRGSERPLKRTGTTTDFITDGVVTPSRKAACARMGRGGGECLVKKFVLIQFLP